VEALTPIVVPEPVPVVRCEAPKRILLVGCGAFAQQAHLPALREAGDRVRLAAVVDRRERAGDVRGACYGAAFPEGVPFIELAPPNDASEPFPATISPHDESAEIEKLASRFPEVDAVIISSPEETHKRYIRWALERGIPTLVDKPLTARRALVEGLSDPRDLIEDWQQLVAASRSIAPFMLAAQRRYQGIYREIAALVRQEYLRSGYGPTFVQCLTNDGLWHTPADYEIQPTYQNGAGKLVHTGYHVLDIVPWIIRHAQGPERPGAAVARIRTAAVFASGFSPADAAGAWAPERVEDSARRRFPPGLGEVNAALQIVLRDEAGSPVCLVQLGMLHEGLSLNPLTGAGTAADRRREAEAGRTKQDVLSIYQGPAAAIFLRRFAKLTRSEGTGLGDRDHLELVHGRNARAPDSAALLERRALTYRADDHAPTAEFLRALDEPSLPLISPVSDHGIAVKLLAAAYVSMETAEAVKVTFEPEEWGMPPGPQVPIPGPGRPR
jgi:predicted dehydrogenase